MQAQDNVFQKFAKITGIAAGTELLLRLKGLILMPIITKILGTLSYGVWSQIEVIVGLIQPVAHMGLPNGLYRYLPGRERNVVRREYYSVISIVFVSTLFWCLLIFLIAKPVASCFFSTSENAIFVMLAGIYTILLSLRYLLLSYFRIYTWAKTLSFFTLFEAIATSLLVGIAVYLGYGLLGAVYVQLAVLGIIVIASSVIIMRNFGLAYPNFQGIKKYFAYGVPLIPTTWFVWVLNSSDRLVISYYCDLKDLGVYSLVYNLGYFLIGFIFNPIFLYFSPMVAKLWNEGQKERVKEMIEYTIKYGLMFTIPALFGFYVLGKPLILLLSTEEFVRGISLIPFVALGYILFMLSSFYEISIGLVEKTKVIPFVFGLCAALNIGLNILMVPRIGILGAAIATTISFAAQIGAFSLYSRCFFKFELCWGFILKSILISTLMALSIYSLIPHSSLLEIFISVIIGGTLYFGGLFVMRGFSQREIDFFYNLLLKTLKIKREQV